LSGYFIIVTDAWMQRPVAFSAAPDGSAHLVSFRALLMNDWAFWQYLHNMFGACVTGSFFVTSVGAYYVLAGKHQELGKLFLKTGVAAGLIASLIQLYPTGDRSGQLVIRYQPTTLAAMEGLFSTESGAPIVLLGQPNMEEQKLDNPIYVPGALSFVTYRRWQARVQGLNEFPRDQWPDNIPLLYYSYHIMVGLGTIFIGIMLMAALLLWQNRLFVSKWMLWIVMQAG
jgi:cytochrome bd ubiquinol oxidase subunit I